MDPDTVRQTLAVVRQFLANIYELPRQVEDLRLEGGATGPGEDA